MNVQGKKTAKLYFFFPTDCDTKGVCWHRNHVFGLYPGYWMGRKKNTLFLAYSRFVTVGEGPLYGMITRQPTVAGQAFTEHVKCICVHTQLVTWPGDVFCLQMTDYHLPLDIRPVNEVSSDGSLMWENVRSR